jgi:hypothetical protein
MAAYDTGRRRWIISTDDFTIADGLTVETATTGGVDPDHGLPRGTGQRRRQRGRLDIAGDRPGEPAGSSQARDPDSSVAAVRVLSCAEPLSPLMSSRLECLPRQPRNVVWPAATWHAERDGVSTATEY